MNYAACTPDADIRARKRAVWLEPLSLEPSRASARVTRVASEKLAIVAKSLEAAGHSSEAVAGFLTRCLSSMFAEDVELLPEGGVKGLLAKHRANAPALARMLEALWREMDVGGFSVALEQARPEVPESADFVMFWWEHGARAVRSGKKRRFGFITPNSVRQTFDRRVVEGHLHPRAPSGAKAVKTAHTSSATQPVRPERSEGSDPLPIKPFAAGSGRTVLIGQTSPTLARRTKTRRYAEW